MNVPDKLRTNNIICVMQFENPFLFYFLLLIQHKV